MSDRALARPLVAVSLCLALLSGTAGSAVAADGEVISRGSDIAGNVYDNGSHARFNFFNLGDCPVGIPSCWVEVKWKWKGDKWYSTWNDGQWTRLPLGQDFSTYCANGRHQYEAYTRLAWMTPTTKRVEFWGQYEKVWLSGASAGYLMAKFMFNATDGYGFRAGYHMETTTATQETSPATLVATSQGGYVTTQC